MSGGHGHTHVLFLHGESAVHRLRPECKVAAAVLFILAVVATPRESFWAYGVFAVVLAGVARVGRVPLPFVARRLTIELPFVAFALFLPFIARGERVDVLGLALSADGLWAAWNILIKGTLGVATTVIMAATTPVAELLEGLDRLRLPKAFTALMGFMVRYAVVISEEMARMKVARLSRGYDPRWFWQTKALASGVGALFLRSYERGERVYQSMLSRGYTGMMPELGGAPALRREWATAMTLPAFAAVVASAAWLLRA